MSILSTNSDGVPSNSAASRANEAALAAAGDWHHSLRTAIRSVPELLQILQLPVPNAIGEDLGHALAQAQEGFPVFAPREYVARMRVGDPNDPLLLQVLPTKAEVEVIPGFGPDPVGDLAAAELSAESADESAEGLSHTSHENAGDMSGVLKKYHSRVLLITTGACAVHCRYCFRRHFPYSATPRGMADWEPALQRIGNDASIEEVILSGGDPLTLRDDWLEQLVERLAAIEHVQRLRVHTRLPIMIPSRVNDRMIGWLRGTRLSPVMVIHANNANELVGQDIRASLSRLVDAGIPVLNQTVLLRGINDSVSALAALSRGLVAHRVMPYYLHQLDRVSGAAHFEVPVEEGRRLVRELRRNVSGYMVPRYVAELPGRDSKTILE